MANIIDVFDNYIVIKHDLRGDLSETNIPVSDCYFQSLNDIFFIRGLQTRISETINHSDSDKFENKDGISYDEESLRLFLLQNTGLI